jgi:hypothetical protein
VRRFHLPRLGSGRRVALLTRTARSAVDALGIAEAGLGAIREFLLADDWLWELEAKMSRSAT